MAFRNALLQTLALFGSFGTLLCCALPAFLVSIGAGAVMAGLISTIPQLVWLSEHKIPLFIVAGVLLVMSGVSFYLNRNAPCPVDPVQAKACLRLRRISLGILGFSCALYAIGFFFAFVVPLLLN